MTQYQQELLQFAVQIAEGAGPIAIRHFRTPVEITSKSDSRFDPVTVADRSIEEYLRNRIREEYPQHGIIGEEHGNTAGNEFTWVIDPIDGTRGFISGSPMWGILIGVTENGRHCVGLMHQPVMNETFYADTEAAWWKTQGNVRRIRTRQTTELRHAVLYCTHPSMFSTSTEQSAFSRLADNCLYSRFGADCYGYCLLAAGFADLVVEGTLKPYDIIPLMPIIESAGGIVTDWQGGPAGNGGKVIAAANKELHAAALSMLNQRS